MLRLAGNTRSYEETTVVDGKNRGIGLQRPKLQVWAKQIARKSRANAIIVGISMNVPWKRLWKRMLSLKRVVHTLCGTILPRITLKSWVTGVLYRVHSITIRLHFAIIQTQERLQKFWVRPMKVFANNVGSRLSGEKSTANTNRWQFLADGAYKTQSAKFDTLIRFSRFPHLNDILTKYFHKVMHVKWSAFD